ncbi:MAG: protein-glutamine gamma-glutamyltransferase [Sporolactobacillus sp.]
MIIAANEQLSADMSSHFAASGNYSTIIFQAMVASPELFAYPSMRELAFEIKWRNETIESAHALYESGAAFATFYYSMCNEDYWNLTGDGGFELKPNRLPADAIRDIFSHGQDYAFECATAMMIVLYKALLGTITDSLFNETFQHIYLWDWQTHPALPLHNSYRVGNGIPGDIRYFKNPEVNPQTPQWQGENAVDLSAGMFYGHGIGIQPARSIIAELNNYRRIGAETTAYLMPNATRPDYLALSALADGQQMNRIRIAAGSSFYSLS